MENCPLCEKNNIDITIKENDSARSFICQGPLKDSHVLIVPKRHVENLKDLTEKESKDFLTLCEEMQHLSKKDCEDDEEPFLFKNYGKYITQPHIHFHVVPTPGGLRSLVTALESDIPFRKKLSQEETDNLAIKLKKLIN